MTAAGSHIFPRDFLRSRSDDILKEEKPYKLVHIPGTPRAMRMRAPLDEPDEPEAEQPEPITPPAWLEADAREIFEGRAAEIRAAGYWQSRFEDALALYSQLFAQYRREPESCSAAKITQMRLLLSELGLTPQSSRGVVR